MAHHNLSLPANSHMGPMQCLSRHLSTFKSGNPGSAFRSFFESSLGISLSCTLSPGECSSAVLKQATTDILQIPSRQYSNLQDDQYTYSTAGKSRSAFRTSVTTHINTMVSTFRDWLRQTGKISHSLRVGMLHSLVRRLSVWSSFVFHSAMLCTTEHPYCPSFRTFYLSRKCLALC